MKGPFAGIKVLDLSQFLSGPRAAQVLAMLGADVVKVEAPSGDTMRLLMAMTGSERSLHTLHQGKRGIVIDLMRPGAADLLMELVKTADVLIENFAPGVMEKLDLPAERLMAENPRLIYASIRGFGRTGPLADRTAFDLIAQATGGTMFANHAPDRPPGVFFGDLCSGAYAAIGIMAALYERMATGRGKLVDISMQDVVYFHNFWAQSDRAVEPDRERVEGILGAPMQSLLSDPDTPMPFWNSYKAKDGYVVIVALTDKQWRALMDILGRPELGTDERFANMVGRIRNAKEGIGVILEWTSQRTVRDILDALSARRIPCGPVNDYTALSRCPQLASRGMLAHAEHTRLGRIDVPGFPVRFGDETPPEMEPGPDMGEHTALVLADWLGLSVDRIRELRDQGISW